MSCDCGPLLASGCDCEISCVIVGFRWWVSHQWWVGMDWSYLRFGWLNGLELFAFDELSDMCWIGRIVWLWCVPYSWMCGFWFGCLTLMVCLDDWFHVGCWLCAWLSVVCFVWSCAGDWWFVWLLVGYWVNDIYIYVIWLYMIWNYFGLANLVIVFFEDWPASVYVPGLAGVSGPPVNQALQI